MSIDSGELMAKFSPETKNALWLSTIVLFVYLVLSGAGVVGTSEVPYAVLWRLGVLPVSVGNFLFYFVCLLVFSGFYSWKKVSTVLALGGLFGVLYLLLVPYTGPKEAELDVGVGIVQSALGVFAIPLLLSGLRDRDFSRRMRVQQLLAIGLLILIMAISTFGVLSLTTLLHPATYDAVLYHFDQALGFQASAYFALVMGQEPWLKHAAVYAYRYLPLGFAILYALQFRYPERRQLDLLGFWILSTLCALVIYHIVPVSGPRYLLGRDFPANLPLLENVPDTRVIISPSARNGVPSMHFGWAFALWLSSLWFRPLWIKVVFFVLMALNIFATLATGEHYLLDLIVAVPFIIAIYSLCLKGVCIETKRRVSIHSALLFLIWLAILRFGLSLVEAVPSVLWAGIVFTIVFAVISVRRLIRAGQDVLDEQNSHNVSKTKTSRELWLIAGLFVFSGFSGLVYEVVFAKSLALTFGSTALATYTVLAIYMGGMSIGSWLGGVLQERISRPLLGYAFCEIAIGVYCALTPLFFPLVQSVYVSIAGGVDPASPSLLFVRLILGAGVLLVPTVLMGVTMPFLVRHFSDRQEQLGVSVALLYSTNTLGAAIGALLTGYLFIPAVGVLGTTLLAAALNLLVALLAIKLFVRFGTQLSSVGSASVFSQGAVEEPVGRALGLAALVVLAVGGAVTLALETVYIHLLAVVAGNSAYAFALMLFTFLIGLSVGAVAVKRLLELQWPLATLLMSLEFCLALVILVGVFLWELIPGYFGDYQFYPMSLSFSQREFIRGVVCWLAMFPPAVLIGAIYPVAMQCIGRSFPEKKVRILGYAMALNTLGNIIGVVFCGFFLLPAIGALKSIHLLAFIAIALATMVFVVAKPEQGIRLLFPLPIVLLAFWAQPGEFNYNDLASGANVYFARQREETVIDHSESLDGGLTTVSVMKRGDGTPVKTLLTNGKFQGNDAEQGEVKAQVGFALAPLMHTTARGHALVIGYGTGMSARTLHEAGFESIDIVELSADIMRMADQHFEKINKRVSKAKGVSVAVTDGRNYLLLNPAKYDVVSMEISSIWFAGAASLYNREFYQLVKRRLNENGVLQQWVQLHHLRTEDMLSILATLRAEFRYVWLYYIGGQGILVASNSEKASPSKENADALNNVNNLRPLLSLYGEDSGVLLDTLVATPDIVDKALQFSGVPFESLVSTDNNLYLEYATPHGNALDGAASVEANMSFLRRFSPDGSP